MSVFQFYAAVDGYISANTPEGEQGLTNREMDDLWDWISG